MGDGHRQPVDGDGLDLLDAGLDQATQMADAGGHQAADAQPVGFVQLSRAFDQGAGGAVDHEQGGPQIVAVAGLENQAGLTAGRIGGGRPHRLDELGLLAGSPLAELPGPHHEPAKDADQG